MSLPILERVAQSPRHRTFFYAAGETGAPIVFVHGWPELAISWRHQLPVFAGLGFRAVAPDMRGYGRSAVPAEREAYALEEIVGDMVELLDHLGVEKAVWVGHDWGGPVVWALAQHHPERCHGVAALCVPYVPAGFAPATLIPLANRTVYPEAQFPAAQWDYQLFYEEDLAAATAQFEADVGATVRAMFRSGDPTGRGKPAGTAFVRANRGRTIPDLPRDPAVLSAEDESRYAAALQANGFTGPCSWYLNAEAAIRYAARAKARWTLTMPTLFLHGAHDHVCDTLSSDLAAPMRAHCADLTEAVVPSGHWMAQEKPLEVNAALARWLAAKLPHLWRVQEP